MDVSVAQNGGREGDYLDLMVSSIKAAITEETRSDIASESYIIMNIATRT